MDAENAAIIDIKWATHDTKVPTVLSRRIYLGLRYAESSTDGAVVVWFGVLAYLIQCSATRCAAAKKAFS